jgi:predicted kinase
MPAELIIPVAIPGCGKSTFGAIMFNGPNDRIHSTDAIREELAGNAQDQSKNDDVFKTFHDRIYSDLVDGHRVYADATNLTPRARQELRDIAGAVLFTWGIPVGIRLIVFSNVPQGVHRNQKRDRVVPDHAMHRMLEQWEDFRLNLGPERHFYDSIIDIKTFS